MNGEGFFFYSIVSEIDTRKFGRLTTLVNAFYCTDKGENDCGSTFEGELKTNEYPFNRDAVW